MVTEGGIQTRTNRARPEGLAELSDLLSQVPAPLGSVLPFCNHPCPKARSLPLPTAATIAMHPLHWSSEVS